MQPFLYSRAANSSDALKRAAGQPDGPSTSAAVQFLAGGTVLLDLMKLGTMRPRTLIDLADLREGHDYIRADTHGLRLGALTRMQSVADDPIVNRDYPVIAQTMQLAASAQLRNMATLGGNVLQRSRCNYFRHDDWSMCNKRNPGSGCAALAGVNRNHAVLGVNERCISAYPGDFAQALVALDAAVQILGPQGTRTLPFAELHRGPEHPEHETVLRPGELITEFSVPAGPWTRRSTYVKVRDRESYEFGIASAAVALDLQGTEVRTVRIGLGGVAYRPWRARDAEAVLMGRELNEASARQAARAAFAAAQIHGRNAFKPALGAATLVRALLQAQAMQLPEGSPERR
ncbi:MAG TPA: xanthine dehydrogenase family protein subunit M [Steroidobacteraceae bacterium]|nr:xanthine dehydrogenase family protein subunit M [Steroidobacteraceae bacterium]